MDRSFEDKDFREQVVALVGAHMRTLNEELTRLCGGGPDDAETAVCYGIGAAIDIALRSDSHPDWPRAFEEGVTDALGWLGREWALTDNTWLIDWVDDFFGLPKTH